MTNKNTTRRAGWLLGTLATCAILAADPPEQRLETLCGTVRTVEPAAQRIRVITGVGHSLRAMEFHAGPPCRVKVAGTTARLNDIERGEVVVVHYRKTADLYQAELIETGTLPDDERRGAR